MNIKLLIVGVTSILSACASKPYSATDREVDKYIDGLGEFTQSDPATRSYVHEQHGELFTDIPPLSSVYEECVSVAYEGFSIKLGNHVIDNYRVMEAIERQFTQTLLRNFALIQNKRELVPTIFDDGNLSNEILKVTKARELKNQCLAESGWQNSKVRMPNTKT